MDSRKYEKFSNLFFVTKKFKEGNLVYHQIKSEFYQIFFEICTNFLCENTEVGISKQPDQRSERTSPT